MLTDREVLALMKRLKEEAEYPEFSFPFQELIDRAEIPQFVTFIHADSVTGTSDAKPQEQIEHA